MRKTKAIKKIIKRKNGITLIALVITIIVLLILAGVSISMIAGDNSILQRATDAKIKTDEVTAKEQIQIEVLGSFGKYADLEMDRLKENLQSIGAEVTGESFPITATLNGASYTIDEDGNVTKAGPTLTATLSNVKVVNSSGREVEANSIDPATTKLYINFEVSLAEGSITSVTYNGTALTATNGVYSQEVTANGDYSFVVNGKIDGESASDTKKVTVSQFAVRVGISVGDYITYESPAYKNSTTVSINDAETGYSSYNVTTGTPKTLSAKNLFRVLDIDKETGEMKLLGEITSSDPTVNFYGAKGYNNAVYTLDTKCNALYGNPSLGITAQSVKLEDITDRFITGTTGTSSSNSTGKAKLAKYINEQVTSLSTKTGTNMIAVNTENNKITYARAKGYYPDIFKYEAGGILDGTATEGSITGSQSYSGYNGLANLTNEYTQVTNNNGGNLVVPYTYYYTFHDANDFDVKYGDSVKLNNMFFGRDEIYWLASRCICCSTDVASFGLYGVSGWVLSGSEFLFDSNGNNRGRYGYRVRPVITLPSGVQVTKGSNPTAGTVAGAHTVVIP